MSIRIQMEPGEHVDAIISRVEDSVVLRSKIESMLGDMAIPETAFAEYNVSWFNTFVNWFNTFVNWYNSPE